MPNPKPPGQRRRRNAGQAQWKKLPASGREGKPPSLPRKKPAWLKSTREWWARVWASPMATVWLNSDVDVLFRLAAMKDVVWRKPNSPSLHAQITALEDRLGLTPKARRNLQWEISQAEPDQEGPSPQPRHLRAVDS